MEQMFTDILDKDERVLKVFKPDKSRACFTIFFSYMLLAVFSALFAFAFEGEWYYYLIGELVFFAIFMMISLLFVSLWYKKTFFAVTNKRIIIRTGYIGVDYKALDISSVGAVNVNVSLVDKIIRKNTGSIAFGSMSSPMIAANGNRFMFSYIYNPYVVYKEIKAIIDEYKK